MSEEKQIDIDIAVEAMASAARERTVACNKCEYYKEGSCLKPIDLDCNDNEDILNLCDAIYEKGYRKATDVVEDIFSDFESILFSLMYLDFDGKYHLRKMNADRVTMIFERYYKIKKKYTEEGK